MDRPIPLTLQQRIDPELPNGGYAIPPQLTRVYSNHKSAPRGSMIQIVNNTTNPTIPLSYSPRGSMEQIQDPEPPQPTTLQDHSSRARGQPHNTGGSLTSYSHQQVPSGASLTPRGHPSAASHTSHPGLNQQPSAKYVNRLNSQQSPLDQDVACIKRLMGVNNAIDFNNPPICNFSDLQRMEVAAARVKNPAVDPTTFADFIDDPAWLQVRARRVVVALKNLHETEDRPTLLNGKPSTAVNILRAKKPIELLICAWKMLRAILKAQKGELALPPRSKIAHYVSYMARFCDVEECLTVNKLLVRSCFENDGWIDRIAANPTGERKIKMQNEKGNEQQHSKIGFAVDAKMKDPTIDFDVFAKSTTASNSTIKRPRVVAKPKRKSTSTSRQLRTSPDAHNGLVARPAPSQQGYAQFPSNAGNVVMHGPYSLNGDFDAHSSGPVRNGGFQPHGSPIQQNVALQGRFAYNQGYSEQEPLQQPNSPQYDAVSQRANPVPQPGAREMGARAVSPYSMNGISVPASTPQYSNLPSTTTVYMNSQPSQGANAN